MHFFLCEGIGQSDQSFDLVLLWLPFKSDGCCQRVAERGNDMYLEIKKVFFSFLENDYF